MKKNDENSLKKVINRLIKAYGWEEKMDSVDLMNSWDKIVGGIIAKHTTNLYVKDKTLYVSLDSSVLRSELHMARTRLIDMINKEVGKKIIEDIVLR